MKMNEKNYRTSDFRFASYLSACYGLIPSIVWLNSNKAEFVYNNSAKIDYDKAAESFFNKKKDVSALELFNAVSCLKSLLYSCKSQRDKHYENEIQSWSSNASSA